MKQAKDVDYEIIIWSIPVDEWRWVGFTDSSTDTTGNQRHQKGYIMGVSNRYFHRGQYVPVSVLAWKSVKHTRKASSPQLCETYAASDCIVELAWLKCLMESMTWTGFDIVTRRRHDRPRPEKLPFILPEEQELQRDPESIVVSDSKGLYDSLNSDLP